MARTVVLKLKTSDFRTLTRSLTPATRPSSAQALADIACALRDRVDPSAAHRYRLVGVGLSGSIEAGDDPGQGDLFEDNAPR